MLGGLAAGFLGAGLFGMLFGHGFMGGMGGFASFLGLLIQIGLVVIVARLAWAWWQRRNQPAYASGPSLRDNHVGRSRPGFGGFAWLRRRIGLRPTSRSRSRPRTSTRSKSCSAKSRPPTAARTSARFAPTSTPEMLSYFSEELAQNASRGVINQISDVKLVQGDLSEAWREGDDEYATVAMRYSLDDKLVDRASGRVVEQEPSEASEFWTFRRARGGHWVLSAVQQHREWRRPAWADSRMRAWPGPKRPAISFACSRFHGIRLDELEMFGLVPGPHRRGADVALRLMLSTYLATASSFGASMICTKS